MTPAYILLVLIASITGAFTDISSGRVRNKHLIIFLAVWTVIVASEYFISHSLSIQILPFAINFLFAVITAVIFYMTDIWAPGDCKFYIVISLIFPMRFYVVRDGNIFPALNFVIYSFALGYIFLIITTFMRKNGGKININYNFSFRNAISILANAGVISFFNILLNTCAPDFFYANQMLCVLFSIALIFLIHNKFDPARKIIGLMGLIFSILSNTFINLALSLVIASIIEFISNRVRVNTYREISADEIRPGMILAFVSLWAMKKCTDPELPKITTENRRSRITKSQAKAIKIWCRNNHSNIIIVEMMPFAPFIAGAVLIEILRFILLGR